MKCLKLLCDGKLIKQEESEDKHYACEKCGEKYSASYIDDDVDDEEYFALIM